MNKLKFYSKMPDMECIAGDTLPAFVIAVEGGSLSGCRMQLIAAKSDNLVSAVICKECTTIGDGFRVQLDSSDTSKLTEGTYFLHFRLIDADGADYRKLGGSLYVHSAPKGGS